MKEKQKKKKSKKYVSLCRNMIQNARFNKVTFSLTEEEETEHKHDNSLEKHNEVDKKRIGENCPVQISLVDWTGNELKRQQGRKQVRHLLQDF